MDVVTKNKQRRAMSPLTAALDFADTAPMRTVNVLFAKLRRRFQRNVALITSVSILSSACSATDGPSTMPPLNIPQESVRAVCWSPPDIDEDVAGEYFVMGRENDPPISSKQRPAFDWAVADGALIYKFSEDAPIQNLRLLPLKYSEPWCTRIPKPTDEAVLRMLNPCATAAWMPGGRAATKNMLGQTEGVPYRSPLFCNQPARMAPTTQEIILLRARNEAFQEAYDYAHKTAKALTLASSQIEAVVNKSDSWLKQKLTSDPGSIEQIQQGLADTLNSIEAPPVYDDLELERIALLGFDAGFDNGKFEVEAKLFAIDAGVMLIEFAAMEVALGPLGGAKLVASAVSKGAKAATVVAGKGSQLLHVATTKGGQALVAAMKRLENIPIFIPGAAGGAGGAVRLGAITKPISARMHRYWLEKAMKAPPFNRLRQAGESLHHMIAHGDGRASIAREKLAKFKINIDDAWNGVFLPATSKSPNPKGSIVHSMVHSHDYYQKVEAFLDGAKSQKEVIRRLQRIRETLENGTFFDVRL